MRKAAKTKIEQIEIQELDIHSEVPSVKEAANIGSTRPKGGGFLTRWSALSKLILGVENEVRSHPLAG